MGTHSPANMSLTSSWSIEMHRDGEIRYVFSRTWKHRFIDHDISLRLAATQDLTLSYKKHTNSSETPVSELCYCNRAHID